MRPVLMFRYLFFILFQALSLPCSYHGEGRLPTSPPFCSFDLDRSIFLSSLFSMFLLFFSLLFGLGCILDGVVLSFGFTTSFGVGGPSSSQTHTTSTFLNHTPAYDSPPSTFVSCCRLRIAQPSPEVLRQPHSDPSRKRITRDFLGFRTRNV